MSKILVIIPAYNEELVLQKNVKLLIAFLDKNVNDWEIVVADNASTDNTSLIAKELVKQDVRVKYLHISQKGRGLAIRSAVNQFEAEAYLFMDADLAVKLDAVNEIINYLDNGWDLVIGSRFLENSIVSRSLKREVVSKIYNYLADRILKSKISDFQCGFKAFTKKIAEKVLPLTKDNGFFWDTEILYLCENLEYKIKEIPVNWVEYRDAKRKSTVKVLQTSFDYLRKIRGLRRRGIALAKKQINNSAKENNNTGNLREP